MWTAVAVINFLLLSTVVATGGEECQSAECKKLASRMLVQMAHDTKPCNNFYRYACGGLFSDPYLKEYDFSKDVYDRLRSVLKKINATSSSPFQQLKAYYTSCKNQKSKDDYQKEWVHGVMEALEGVGQFSPPKRNFTRLFLTLLKYDSPMIFDITLDVDEKNSSQFALKMTIPTQMSPFIPEDPWLDLCDNASSEVNLNNIYGSFKNCKEDMLLRSVTKFVKALQILNAEVPLNIIDQDIAEIGYELEKFYSLASKEMPLMAEQKENLTSRKYSLMTVRELTTTFKEVKWQTLLRNLLERDIPLDTPVQVYALDYFKKIFGQLASKRKREAMYNALLGAFIHKLYHELVLYRHNNDDYCLHLTSVMMEDVAAAAYLSTFEEEELAAIINGTQNVFHQLKDTLKHLFDRSEWLDPGSRSLLISKLQDVQLDASNVAVILSNSSHLEHEVDEFSVDSENYFRNSMKLFKRGRSLMYSNYGRKPADSTSIWTYFLSPIRTASTFVYGLNLIAMPIALLANPFFGLTVPKYVVMARLGAELAHQLAHHFDSEGIFYSNGIQTTSPLLERPSSEYYRSMELCFNQQYSFLKTGFAPNGRQVDYKLDSKLSKNERLADDMSVLLLYAFLQNSSFSMEPTLPFANLTNSQSFFVLLAQNFCSKQSVYSSTVSLFEEEKLPSFLRVNHIASNSKGFFEAFRCPGFPYCEIFPILTTDTLDFFPIYD